MKRVVILFGKSNWKTSKYPAEGEYRECYEYFYNLARTYDIEMFRASYKWFNSKTGSFDHAHSFDGTKWLRADNVKPDLVYDKSNMVPEKIVVKKQIEQVCPTLDSPEFGQLIGNKIYTNTLFHQWAISSRVIASQSMLQAALRDIPGDMAVLKPIDSFGGQGIVIDKKEIIGRQKVTGTMLVQEFIDTSEGITGLTPGKHDLRVVMIDGKPVQSLIRVPAEGKLLANMMQGGSEHIINVKDIPSSVLPVLDYANKLFAVFPPSIYAIDFMFTGGGKRAYVVELNDTPGLYFYRENYHRRDEMFVPTLELFKKYLGI